MNIRCLIIDDSPLARDLLQDYLGKLPFLELVAITGNPLEGLSVIQSREVDLIFLDIQMPELTGFNFMKITGQKYKVILTTAYPEYALEGYEYDVVDYLLKPISFERFYRAVMKAVPFFSKEKIQIIGTASHYAPRPKYLFIKTENRVRKIDLQEIQYIESLQNYIAIHTISDKLISLQTLKKIEEELPPDQFVRVHKSYIVSIGHIYAIERNRIFIANAIIPVGENFKESFRQRIRVGPSEDNP